MYLTTFVLLSFAAGLGFDVIVNYVQDYSNEAGIDAMWSGKVPPSPQERLANHPEQSEFAVESPEALRRAIREQIDEIINKAPPRP